MSEKQTPACFDSAEDYAGWVSAAVKARTDNVHRALCADCTGAYAAKMRSRGRCDNPLETPGVGYD